MWVWLGDPDSADETLIADFPYHDMRHEWHFKFGRYAIAANYMLMVDNLMDLTHLRDVHGSTIGGNPNEHDDAELTTEQTRSGAHCVPWMMESTPPPSFVKAAGFAGKVEPWQDFAYVAPASALQWAGGYDSGSGARENRNKPGGLAVRLFHHATPADDNSMYYFFSTAVRGKALERPANVAFHQISCEPCWTTRLFLKPNRRGSTKTRRAHCSDAPMTKRSHSRARQSARCTTVPETG